jgi:2-oxoglutarate dehydrogenase E1 component
MAQDFSSNTFLYGSNAGFVEELYERYLKDPASIDESWRAFFAQFGGEALQRPQPVQYVSDGSRVAAPAPLAAPSGDALAQTTDSVRALMLIHAYRVRGNLIADLDPLGLEINTYHPELDPATYGFSETDYDRPIFIDGYLGLKTATLREILAILRQVYCQKIGVEFMHIQYPEQKAWIQRRIENDRGNFGFSKEDKLNILDDLIEVEAFEQFLQMKTPGTKRFSVQGADVTIPGLEAAIVKASELGVEEIVFGMPHRGRLNVLTTVLGKPYMEMFSLFLGNQDFPEWVDISGDVKYHLGTSSDRLLPNGKKVHLSMTANPSHLEVVNPVVVGKVRAKQDIKNDRATKTKVMGILLHGDAAFAGQGSVAETLSLSELRGYRTGGTVHLIVNNQIGFTTSPKYSRFTPYPSDVAKMVQAPIFHVNGDDPEAVAYVCRLAVEFRQTFKRDVVVDIFCYRKYGHNESDEPMFTQPLMYKRIAQKPLPAEIYYQQLVKEGHAEQGLKEQKFEEYLHYYEQQYEAAKNFKPNKADWLEGQWSGFEKPNEEHPLPDTGISEELMQEVGKAITSYPKGFNINRKIDRQLETKKKMFESGEGFDWATAEAVAFGSLLLEGYPVRLSGQDSGRGTFSQRHSVLIDQETEERYVMLNHIREGQREFEVLDSSLSELAILGVEYGYTLSEPNALVMWEAQFGDFANGAQVIIDQFIASGEIKWLRMSGLVMLLPHGYEGQGPEHSSARLERFLQLCAEDNMQVVNCTTPANYFHVLRRQLHRKFRKPLIIMTPKSLLRHKLCLSSKQEMLKGTTFLRVIPETAKQVDANVKRVVFCTGKVYYDLYESREARGIDNVAIVRLEQLYPFPAREIREQMERYPNADVVWCQEEPENMGAWHFLWHRLQNLLEEMGHAQSRVRFAGRRAAASPATGYYKVHEKQQQMLVDQALTLAEASAKATSVKNVKKAVNG